MCNVIQTLLYW